MPSLDSRGWYTSCIWGGTGRDHVASWSLSPNSQPHLFPSPYGIEPISLLTRLSLALEALDPSLPRVPACPGKLPWPFIQNNIFLCTPRGLCTCQVPGTSNNFPLLTVIINSYDKPGTVPGTLCIAVQSLLVPGKQRVSSSLCRWQDRSW